MNMRSTHNFPAKTCLTIFTTDTPRLTQYLRSTRSGASRKRVYICIYIYICALYAYMRAHACIFVCVCVCVYTHTHTYIYTYIYIYIYIYMYVYSKEPSRIPNSSTLELDRPQHDRSATCVIALFFHYLRLFAFSFPEGRLMRAIFFHLFFPFSKLCQFEIR